MIQQVLSCLCAAESQLLLARLIHVCLSSAYLLSHTPGREGRIPRQNIPVRIRGDKGANRLGVANARFLHIRICALPERVRVRSR